MARATVLVRAVTLGFSAAGVEIAEVEVAPTGLEVDCSPLKKRLSGRDDLVAVALAVAFGSWLVAKLGR